MNIEDLEKENKKRELSEAKAHISMCEAMKVLAENEEFHASIKVAGVKIDICDNRSIAGLLNNEISQAKRFLKGDTNSKF